MKDDYDDYSGCPDNIMYLFIINFKYSNKNS